MATPAVKASSLFRKVALEKALTPEHPNTPVHVVTSKGRFALFAIIGILAAVVVWSIFGTLPTKVHASGILVRTDAVMNVESHSTGSITDISVRPGELVRAGEVVARVSQPEILQSLIQAKQRLDQLMERQAQFLEISKRKHQLSKVSFEKKRKSLGGQIAYARERIHFLETKRERQGKLEKNEFVSRISMEELALQLFEANDTLQDRQADLESLVAEEAEAEKLRIREQNSLSK